MVQCVHWLNVNKYIDVIRSRSEAIEVKYKLLNKGLVYIFETRHAK